MESLLALLQDGAFHSGEELGNALGVSRAAVWKQLKKIEQTGVRLESVRGKGYRLDPAVQLLDVDELQHALREAGAQDIELELKRVTGSTNDDAAQYCRPGLSGLPVVVAEYQESGRGRRGRQWLGRYGANIYLSAVWRCARGAAALEGLSLVVGVSVVEALEQLGYTQIGLKWPNDLLYRGAKLAGILVEVRGDMMGECFAIIGLGLNLHLDAAEQDAIGQPATALELLSGERPDKQRVIAAVLARLQRNLEHFEREGFRPFRARWQQYDVFYGAPIRIVSGPHAVSGMGAGISESGSYIINTEDGPYECQGGEISIRAQI